MRFLVVILLAFVGLGVNAQTTDDLVAYYTFNDSTANDVTGGGSNGAIVGSPDFVCGVEGAAMRLDGADDHVLLLGIIGNFFELDDFTMSFYFRPVLINSVQTIFSKKEACNDDNAFVVRYVPNFNSLSIEISESSTKKVLLSPQLDFNKCWQHATIVRQGGTVSVYINGVFAESGSTNGRVNLTNNAVMGIAEGACVGVTDSPFGGILDEVRIYDRALDRDEIEDLYFPLEPDNIITQDTTVFLGNDVSIETGNTCSNVFSWTPSADLDDPNSLEPVISPSATQVYTLSFTDNTLGCTTQDSILITVIDPSELDCKEAFLPNAFTPNDDGRNDEFGLSNPYAISDLISFEIFDRWGGLVFLTDDPFERWDGSFKGEPMNPGVLLYKVRFRCDGEELVNVGSVSLIR